MFLLVYVYVDLREHRCLMENQRMVWNILGAGVIANCESSGINIGNPAPNLYKIMNYQHNFNI